jgi:hypothetical protein
MFHEHIESTIIASSGSFRAVTLFLITPPIRLTLPAVTTTKKSKSRRYRGQKALKQTDFC